MPEQFKNFFGSSNEYTPENREDVLLENPENVPEASEKYKEMRCFETFEDDDHIWRDGFAMSQDFLTIIYKTGEGKTVKTYNRKSGDVRAVESGFVQDVQRLKDGQNFGAVVGKNLKIYDIKTLKERGSLEITPVVGGNQYDQTPDFNKIVFNGYGSDVAIYDLETGDKTVAGNATDWLPAGYLICLRDSKTVAVGFKNKIQLLDLEKEQYIAETSEMSSTTGYGEVKALAESNDGKQIISASHGGEIRFWDKDTLKMANEIKATTIVDGVERSAIIDSIKETRDSAHIIACGGGRIKIIHKETGQVIREIPGDNFFESSNGMLAVIRGDKIEFWNWGVSEEDEINEVIIHNGKRIKEKDRFEEFTEQKGETVEGMHWHFFENIEAQRLSRQKKFKWGDERIYFEVPLDQLERLGGLVVKAAKEAHIPTTFKYVDTEASSPEMVQKDVTRFVVNFISVKDAKKFYKILSGYSAYSAIKADRNIDYLAHNIDGKAFYAQGFKELREIDRNQILNSLKKYTQNPDGSYSRPSDEGGVVTISQEEYDKLTANADINGLLKKVWDKK